METGNIPPNLHYTAPLKGVKSLKDGRLKVVTETTPWEGGYMGINSFGFGGANCHAILKSHTKKKINEGAKNDDLPRLVAISGRTEESVKVFLDDVSEDRKRIGKRSISSIRDETDSRIRIIVLST
jgi:fatty acid synthase